MYSISVRRSVLLRLITSVWALWFGVAFAVPAALPPCPAHGAHMGHHAAAGSEHHRGAPSHESHKACTCLGACCSAPVVAFVLGAPIELPAIRVTTQASRNFFPDASSSRSAVRYSHPYANGPPADITA